MALPFPPEFFRSPSDWLGELKNKLGPDYSLQRNDTLLYYRKPLSNRDTLVFFCPPKDTVVTFNVGGDGDQPSVTQRETVKWVDSRHLYPMFNELVAVDNQRNVHTFSEKSNRWLSSLGENAIAGYENSANGSQMYIYVFDNQQNSRRVRSPWAVDIKTGDLVPAI